MDITVGEEQVFRLLPRLDLQQAREKAWDKKTSIFSSGLAGLLSRPKSEEVQISYIEYRCEPFWHIVCDVNYEYDRTQSYAVSVTSPEVQHVTIDGKQYNILDNSRNFKITGVEHCVERGSIEEIFDAVRDQKRADWKRYLSNEREVVADPAEFAPEGCIVVPPEIRASAVVRKVLSSLLRPIQADKIQEERVDVKTVNLYFRPVYAFEYIWNTRGKTAVAEFDGLTGEMSTGGITLREQVEKVMTRDLLFDVSAEALNLLVPGGSIAVKMAKAVVNGYQGTQK